MNKELSIAWNKFEDRLPKTSGDYLLKFSDGSTALRRFNRGFLGLKCFSHWSPENPPEKEAIAWYYRGG